MAEISDISVGNCILRVSPVVRIEAQEVSTSERFQNEFEISSGMNFSVDFEQRDNRSRRFLELGSIDRPTPEEYWGRFDFHRSKSWGLVLPLENEAFTSLHHAVSSSWPQHFSIEIDVSRGEFISLGLGRYAALLICPPVVKLKGA